MLIIAYISQNTTFRMVVLKKMSHLLLINTDPNFSLFEKWLHLKQNLSLVCFSLYVKLPGEIQINIQFHYEFDF